MKAVCWYGKHDVRVETVPDPQLLNPRDAIIKVTSTAVCGSDLHLYDGVIPTMERGDILGHEFMGEVVEVGRDVSNLKMGDRVVVPFTIPVATAFSVSTTSGHCATTRTRMRGWQKNCMVAHHRGCLATRICWVATRVDRPNMCACRLPM